MNVPHPRQESGCGIVLISTSAKEQGDRLPPALKPWRSEGEEPQPLQKKPGTATQPKVHRDLALSQGTSFEP